MSTKNRNIRHNREVGNRFVSQYTTNGRIIGRDRHNGAIKTTLK
ncbi:Uncharacterised protein [Vibrio cholerae]|nr:Uncharacterised protein [Vibrio cholerae]CSI38503.1 Uncharacterised protein [Vibrio cholerae]